MKIKFNQNLIAIRKFQNAFKIAISIVLVFLATKFLGATPIEQAWGILTVFVVMSVRVGATLYASFYRVIGTLAGGILALFLLKILPTQYNWAIIFGLFIIGIICGRIIEDRVTLRIIGVTAILIFILGTMLPDPLHLSVERLGFILLSILISFLVSIVLFPQHARRVLVEKIATELRQNAEFLTALVNSYLQGKALPATARADLLTIKKQLADSRQLLIEMKLELWVGEKSSAVSLLSNFIDHQASIYHSLVALTKIVDKMNGKDVATPMQQGFELLANVIKKTFNDLALYVYDPNVMFERHVLTNALQQLENELTAARTASFFGKYSNDMVLGLYAFVFNLEMIANELISIKKIIAKVPQ